MALLGRKFKQLARKLRFEKRHEAVRKGFIPLDIVGEGQEAIRYEISIEFLHCSCFKKLLDEYEDEIHTHATGPITLPCSVRDFEQALYRDRIDSRIKKAKIAKSDDYTWEQLDAALLHFHNRRSALKRFQESRNGGDLKLFWVPLDELLKHQGRKEIRGL